MKAVGRWENPRKWICDCDERAGHPASKDRCKRCLIYRPHAAMKPVEQNRSGTDYSLYLRPWAFELRHQMKTEFIIEIHDWQSMERDSLALAIGQAILVAMERCSQ